MSAGLESGGAGAALRVQVPCIRAEEQFRPTRVTPKPIVQGPQTATVVGPSGEEIHTDEVRPREGAVPLGPLRQEGRQELVLGARVAPLGRQELRLVDIPRIGQEVVVDFLEGDPDRPLVTGRVYNAETDAAVRAAGQQDAERASSRARRWAAATRNANEIRFEDKKGAEQV